MNSLLPPGYHRLLGPFMRMQRNVEVRVWGKRLIWEYLRKKRRKTEG